MKQYYLVNISCALSTLIKLYMKHCLNILLYTDLVPTVTSQSCPVTGIILHHLGKILDDIIL